MYAESILHAGKVHFSGANLITYIHYPSHIFLFNFIDSSALSNGTNPFPLLLSINSRPKIPSPLRQHVFLSRATKPKRTPFLPYITQTTHHQFSIQPQQNG